MRDDLDGTPAASPRRDPPVARAPESEERDAAWRRGRERGAASSGDAGEVEPELARHAFTALAEGVRDYAIFLMDPQGVIRYWGEGARLMKRWTKAEAEGAHLRMLYPEGGAEDGTAEAHLRDAVAQGEYVGEGHRVRSDGSTFWAHVTLTALTARDGALLGFAKVTRDATARRLAEAAGALAGKLSELDMARGERAALSTEVDVLKEEVAVLRDELQRRDEPAGGRPAGDRA